MPGQSIEEKLERFRDAVYREVQKTIAVEDEAVKEQASADMESFQIQLENELSEREKSQMTRIEQEHRQEISRMRLAVNKTALLCRKNALDALEEEIIGQIKDYLKTETYQEKLLSAIKAFEAKYALHNAVLYVRPEDATLVCKAGFPEENIKADRQNKLGGFAVKDEENGLYYDCTVSSRLKQAMEQIAKDI